MSSDRPESDAPQTNEPVPPEGAATPTGEPVVSEAPSSRQSADAPPAGSEPQGNITAIATVVAILVIVVLLVVILL